MEVLLMILSLIALIVSICIVLWIRAIYMNSVKIKNLLYVQIKLLEKEAESKGIDIEELYKKADKLQTWSFKKESIW
jgi:hypothetical protein